MKLKTFFALAAIGMAFIPRVEGQNINKIAAGGYHSLALQSDGMVVAWGAGQPGQSGDPNYGQSVVPGGLTGVVAIAGGFYHSLALKSDGTVVAWGRNLEAESTVPSGLNGVAAIAAGVVHSLALKSDGTVVAWGQIYNGSAWVTATVPGGLTGAVAIAANSAHNLALKGDGTIVAWGYNEQGEAAVPSGLTGVVAIAAGGAHNLALKADGTVVAWGRNFEGQSTVPDGLTGVVAVAAGGLHSLALKSDGSVVAWGYNYWGQSTVPGGLTGVVAIATEKYTSLALKSDGTVVGWGDNTYGQLPQPLIKTLPISQVSPMGGSVNFSVTASGIAPLNYQWRKDGTNINGATSPVYTISNVQSNDAGNYSVIITNACGSVTSSNAALTVLPIVIMQPPRGNTFREGWNINFSVAVAGSAPISYQWRKDGTNISGATNSAYAISNAQSNDAGSYSVVISNVYGSVTSSNGLLSIAPLGTVVAWGDNYYGQSSVPSGLNGVVGLAAGMGHSLALKSDGTVRAWGWNGEGECNVPGGLSNVVSIVAGNYHSLALKSDGTVVAWGLNSFGQSTVPDGLTGVVSIAAGGYHSLALKADGMVVQWGFNAEGGSISRPVPDGLTGVIQIAAAGGYSLALKSSGTIVVWGGNMATIERAAPDVVAIAAGGYWVGGGHDLALKSNGTVVDSYGPLGLTGAVAIAVGGVYWSVDEDYFYNLALKSNGTVVAWGPGAIYNPASNVPDGLTGVVAIAAGGSHGLALVAGTDMVPNLTFQPSGNKHLLSWPLAAQGFSLQFTTNLADTNSWTTLTNLPFVVDLQNRITNTISGPTKFYRLKK